MTSVATFLAIVAAGLAVSFLWGRALWYFAERSEAFRGWVFFAMGYTRRPTGEVRSALLGAIYYCLGLLAALLFVTVFDLPITSLFALSAAQLGMSILGAAAEISLANLLIDLSCRTIGQSGPERFVEVAEIPWIKGLRQLPPSIVPAAAAAGGVIEEFFFRGVLLQLLIPRLPAFPMVSVAVSGVLFCLQQLLQVQTVFQAMVIGCSCVAISAVGGLLVVLTGSVVPALLSHASFVLFFMCRQPMSGRPPSNQKVELGR